MSVKLGTGAEFDDFQNLTATVISTTQIDVTYGPLATALIGDAMLIVERIETGGETTPAGKMAKICEPVASD